MTTKIPCPSCEKPLGIPEGGHGRRVRCPGCQASLQVEVSDDATRLLTTEEAPEAPPRPKSGGKARGKVDRTQARMDTRETRQRNAAKRRHEKALKGGRLWLVLLVVWQFFFGGLVKLLATGMAEKVEESNRKYIRHDDGFMKREEYLEMVDGIALTANLNLLLGALFLACRIYAVKKPWPSFVTASALYVAFLGWSFFAPEVGAYRFADWITVLLVIGLGFATHSAWKMRGLVDEEEEEA